MLKTVSALILLFCLISQAGFTQTVYNEPEGVVFDYDGNRYFVTNWRSGAIVEIDSTGQTSYFKTSLTSCSGIHIYNGVLYVSSNNRTLYGFDLSTGNNVLTLALSNSGLHGITSDTSGFLYVADWSNRTIYRVNPVTQAHTDYVTSGLSGPLGLEFDIRNNRVIVVEMTSSNNVKGIDLTSGSVSTITTLPFENLDDITSDQDGNFYISGFNDDFGKIFMYDNAFANPPVEVDSIDSHGLLDIFYNQRDDLIAATIYWQNDVRFIPVKYKMDIDTSYGWAPLDVNFLGFSDYEAESWLWDFDDGDQSTAQNPSHTYNDPGWYNGSMTIYTTAGDTLTRNFSTPIAVLADTLHADTAFGYASESVPFEVKIRNNAPLSRIVIPVEYLGSLLLTYDSASVAGCRTEGYNKTMTHFDSFNKKLTYEIRTQTDGSTPPLPPGEGVVLKIYFSYHATAKPGVKTEVKLDGYSTTYDSYLPHFNAEEFEYDPITQNGIMTVPLPPCCVNDRGNVDNDPEDIVDVSDLVFLIDYQFHNGDEPVCFDEADLDLNEIIDVSDLVFMVDYQFRGGTPPPSCLN